ncbi:hypothetical protein [Sphingopyxis sp. EG6]|uniref:hypothetical protein n=1 Tax=Sphingopyxis sp. EG6 TaxID=1874061 RepID=UPI000DC63A17|nr:hypothetical protein [Sphingopyxis sp. EG6]BBB10614.1 hypothetical protein SPYCW_3630 [Sphingopyxis sp. EG6]
MLAAKEMQGHLRAKIVLRDAFRARKFAPDYEMPILSSGSYASTWFRRGRRSLI